MKRLKRSAERKKKGGGGGLHKPELRTAARARAARGAARTARGELRVRGDALDPALQRALAHVDKLGAKAPELLLVGQRGHNEVRKNLAQLRAQPRKVGEAAQRRVGERVERGLALGELRGRETGKRRGALSVCTQCAVRVVVRGNGARAHAPPPAHLHKELAAVAGGGPGRRGGGGRGLRPLKPRPSARSHADALRHVRAHALADLRGLRNERARDEHWRLWEGGVERSRGGGNARVRRAGRWVLATARSLRAHRRRATHSLPRSARAVFCQQGCAPRSLSARRTTAFAPTRARLRLDGARCKLKKCQQNRQSARRAATRWARRCCARCARTSAS